MQERHADSKGAIHFLHVDLSDLPSLKAAAEDFASKEKQLHVLVNNAGIMIPPKGSKNAQGYEIQVSFLDLHTGTTASMLTVIPTDGNELHGCLDLYQSTLPHPQHCRPGLSNLTFLLYQHLAPLLESTAAASPPNTVRVCWAGSLAIDTGAPTGGVPLDENTGAPTVTDDPTTDYSISKAYVCLSGAYPHYDSVADMCRCRGNYLMCHEFAQLHPSIVNVCFNPGELGPAYLSACLPLTHI